MQTTSFVTHHDESTTEKSNTGAKRGGRDGKGRYDLITPFGLMRLAKVYERGAEQKGERNWELGFEWSRCLDSAQRHITQYRAGMRDEDHLAQAVWNLMALMHFEATGRGENNIPQFDTTLTTAAVGSIQ